MILITPLILSGAGLSLLAMPGLTIQSYGHADQLQVRPLVSHVQHLQVVPVHNLTLR